MAKIKITTRSNIIINIFCTITCEIIRQRKPKTTETPADNCARILKSTLDPYDMFLFTAKKRLALSFDYIVTI